MKCKDCDRPLPRVADQWVEMVGFTRVRKQGGVNQIALASPTGGCLCDPCMTKRKRGLQGQGGLFDNIDADV